MASDIYDVLFEMVKIAKNIELILYREDSPLIDLLANQAQTLDYIYEDLINMQKRKEDKAASLANQKSRQTAQANHKKP